MAISVSFGRIKLERYTFKSYVQNFIDETKRWKHLISCNRDGHAVSASILFDELQQYEFSVAEIRARRWELGKDKPVVITPYNKSNVRPTLGLACASESDESEEEEFATDDDGEQMQKQMLKPVSERCWWKGISKKRS